MANLVVTSDSVKVKVEFNDFASADFPHTAFFDRKDILEVFYWPDLNFIEVKMASGSKFDVSSDVSPNGAIIDSIDGVTPSSLLNLAELISELMV